MTEKESLLERAEELGLETQDESGKTFTIAQLKVAIASAESEDEEADADEDGDDEAPLDPADVEKVEAKLAAQDKYRINCTVMIGSRRIEPGRRPVLLTAAQARPLVKLGHAVKV